VSLLDMAAARSHRYEAIALWIDGR
jgi:hypothetical protein